GGERQGAAVEEAFAGELPEHGADGGVEAVEVELTLVPADDLAGRVDEGDRRPGADGVLAPDAEVAVVDHGMTDRQTQDSLANRVGVLLVGELRRVDADDDDIAGVLALQLPQLRQDMVAVNSAEGPEVEQHQFTAQLGDRERVVGIEPVKARGKLRSVDLAGEPRGGHGVSPLLARRKPAVGAGSPRLGTVS